MATEGRKLRKYLTSDLEVYMKEQEKIVGINSECAFVKEVVGNISAEVAGQIAQKQVYIYNLIRLLLSYEQKKSENAAYVIAA